MFPRSYNAAGARPRDAGVDVALILSNLELSVAERFQRNVEAIRLLERTRHANFTPAQLELLDQLERERTRADWGEWLAELDAL